MLKPLFFALLFMTTSGTFAVQAQATGPMSLTLRPGASRRGC